MKVADIIEHLAPREQVRRNGESLRVEIALLREAADLLIEFAQRELLRIAVKQNYLPPVSPTSRSFERAETPRSIQSSRGMQSESVNPMISPVATASPAFRAA